MAISTTAARFIFTKLLKDSILAGENPVLSDLIIKFNEATAGKDLFLPLTSESDFLVEENEESSVIKYNETKRSIHQDLQVLYEELFITSERTLGLFDRWQVGLGIQEKRLEDLERRLTSLLLLSRDDLYKYFIEDHFSNAEKISLDSVNIAFFPQQRQIKIPVGGLSPTKINLNNLITAETSFNVLTTKDIVTSTISPGGEVLNAVKDVNTFWQTRVFTGNSTRPVLGEYIIRLQEETEISRISINLHSANKTSNIQITPFLSTNGFDYQQIDSPNFTQNVASQATFTFRPTTTKIIKLLMSKDRPDVLEKKFHVYEFGASLIELFNEGYDIDATSTFYSKNFNVSEFTEADNLTGFSRVALQACEEIPEQTDIVYYVAVDSDNVEVPASSAANWIPLCPEQRKDPKYPSALVLNEATKRLLSDVSISYDPVGSPGEINPGSQFQILNDLTSAPASYIATGSRYSFLNPEDRILDLQIDETDTGIEFEELEIWRNVGQQGDNTLVRNSPRGWKYEPPYYMSTIQVDSPAGVIIDFGPKTIILDDVAFSGSISIPTGSHIIGVHEDNFAFVPPSLNSLTALTAADPLYPYNHRLLVEGYKYSGSFPSGEDKIYTGVDIFSECKMVQMSVIDFLKNITKDDFCRFAKDSDSGHVYTPDINGEPVPTKTSVFLVKVDPTQANFVNEKFLVKLEIQETNFTDIRLRADFISEDTGRTPILTDYRLKLL